MLSPLNMRQAGFQPTKSMTLHMDEARIYLQQARSHFAIVAFMRSPAYPLNLDVSEPSFMVADFA
jgi:hypothetical protein